MMGVMMSIMGRLPLVTKHAQHHQSRAVPPEHVSSGLLQISERREGGATLAPFYFQAALLGPMIVLLWELKRRSARLGSSR
jgi:hypothetical protein